MIIKKHLNCSLCHTKILKFCDFGELVVANRLLSYDDLEQKEKKFPLSLCFCPKCYLVQLGQVISPNFLYKDYFYLPSVSKTMVNHFKELFESVYKFNLSSSFAFSSVIDIGSNDGTLLKFFKNSKFRILGVDPAKKIAKMANASGVPTLSLPFSYKNSQKIVKKFGKFDVLTATNVFAHIEDLMDLYAGVDFVLKKNGICVVEIGYALDMIQKVFFDSIYHEHIYYFSLHSLVNLFKRTNFEIFDLDRINIHGGSLRIWLKKRGNEKIKIKTDKINQLLALEKQKGLIHLQTYRVFSKKINLVKNKLLSLLLDLKQNGKKIAAFGAPAKGNILLNVFGIDNKIIDFIVDGTVFKQFKFSPGNHLQIFPEEEIYKQNPDFLLVLAWNFIDEIVKKHPSFKGRFIIPLPSVKVI